MTQTIQEKLQAKIAKDILKIMDGHTDSKAPFYEKCLATMALETKGKLMKKAMVVGAYLGIMKSKIDNHNSTIMNSLGQMERETAEYFELVAEYMTIRKLTQAYMLAKHGRECA